ncbi:MAG: DUF1489 domain-containing protein [Rhodobacteraceae bacterium]|nr:DUF1489 domain-containing protein [Paracoccaceae bacterium]
MPISHIHLIKLCVGADSFEDQQGWIRQRVAQAAAKGRAAETRHVTRMWPKRADELLKGGSLYWVIKGQIQARQRILRFDEVIGDDGIRRCAIVMEPELIRTNTATRRPFQGWRYLEAADAPADLPRQRVSDDKLPLDLELALSDIGLR